MSLDPVLTEVRKGHVFDTAALATYLASHLDGDFQKMAVKQYEGGQSNPTFLLEAGSHRYVMRKKPPGKLLRSAHMIEREHRIMAALDGSGVPVPHMYHLCEDDGIIGTPFFIMEAVEGRVTPDPFLQGFSAEDKRALYHQFMEILAVFHGLDHESLGLADFGKPGNYYQRQVDRWSKQYQASKTETNEAMDHLMPWLDAHTPDVDQTTLVHGDFRIGNCILHPSEPKVVAVLDWELSTLGHPMADLAYFAMPYHFVPGTPHTLGQISVPGIPSEEELLALYGRLSGNDATENWSFYMVFQLFRLGAIIQGVVKRGMDGNASSARWKELVVECRRITRVAWDLACKS